MVDLIPIIVVAGIFLGAAGWKYLFSSEARAKRALRRAPRATVKEAREGALIKIVGKLRYAETPPLISPLTDRPCALFRTTVQHRQSSGRSSRWVTIIDSSEFQRDFWVEDSTGKALVKPEVPKVVLVMDGHFTSGTLNEATPRLDAFLARYGETSRGWFFNKNMRYKEGILEEGEVVAVYGICRWEPNPDPLAAGGYRERPMRLTIQDPEVGEMLLSDNPSVF